MPNYAPGWVQRMAATGECIITVNMGVIQHMRQIALIALLARCGALFREKRRLGPIDQIFTRIGKPLGGRPFPFMIK